MAGPWDNVQLAGPPNGPAYINAAVNAASTLGNLVNSGFNAYQQGVNFQNQQQMFPFQLAQAQRQQSLANLFQNGVPTLPNGQTDWDSVFKSTIKAGGVPEIGSALQALPIMQKQQLIDQYLGQGGQSQPNPTAPQAGNPQQIIPNYGKQQSSPRTPYREAGDEGEGVSVNYLAAQSHTDLDGFLKAYPGFRGLLGKNLTEDQESTVADYMLKYRQSIADRGSRNPVQPSGTDEQEPSKVTAGAYATNELKPPSVQGGPPISPASTRAAGKIGSASAPPSAVAGDGLEDQRNRRTAQTERPLSGAQSRVPAEYRGDPLARAQQLRKEASQLRQNARGKIGDILGVSSKRDEDEARAKDEEAKAIEDSIGQGASDLRKRLGDRYNKMSEGIQQNDRAAFEMDNHTRAMFGILENPNLFTGAGQSNLNFLRQVAQNLIPGYNPNTTLPNEALKKVTAQNLQNQLEVLKGDAQEAGESAGRVMLAQIRIMQDAAQNPDISIPTLRYLTELGARASNIQHKIGDMERDYRRTHGGELDAGFEQKLADFMKNPNNKLLSPMEERDIRYVAAPRLPTNIRTDEEQRAWARQHGVQTGDPVRVNKTYPAQYVPSL